MKKIAFVADVHVANHRKFGGATVAGVNRRAKMVLTALEEAVKKANAEGCGTLVVCGDLFDGVRPEPQLIAAVAEVFAASAMAVVVVAGNHDMVSTAAGDHALGPLAAVEGVTVVEEPWVHWPSADTAVLCLPFRPGRFADWAPPALADLARSTARAKHRLLAIHAGVADDKTAAFLRDAHDSVEADALAAMMMEHGIEFAAAGNWHDHRAWKYQETPAPNRTVEIVQCGALAPTGFNNPGLEGYGSLVVWGGKKGWQRHEVEGPRFLTVRGDEAEKTYREAAAKVGPGLLFVCWKERVAMLGQAAATLAEDELALGLGGVDAQPDDKEAREAVAQAAANARAASTLEEALRAYVDGMPLPGSVERDDVHARAAKYLGV
jgi:hypothetical protein